MDIEAIKKRVEEQRAKDKVKEAEALRKYWENPPRFETARDVPRLPIVEDEEWNTIYAPALIKGGAIPKEQLVDGGYYYGDYRNSNIGRWNAEKQKFDIIRFKFGFRWDACNHFEDNDRFAVFVPLRMANDDEVAEMKGQEEEIKNY